ncbi:hypothetical protein HF086_002711 [Spodoptera exigua]|uniref:Uncharacterized protein n=1 Tax=Spodoptera exigua TaxID=7107 RepID=A0A922MAG1_SPOEX|nr:hypothetical protein HF086_002711 [Spodoptera exigua]
MRRSVSILRRPERMHRRCLTLERPSGALMKRSLTGQNKPMSSFTQILAHESFAQLSQIFEEYKNISGRTIEQAIKAEIGGELKDALSAIGQ